MNRKHFRYSPVKFPLTCLQQRFQSSRIGFDLLLNLFANLPFSHLKKKPPISALPVTGDDLDGSPFQVECYATQVQLLPLDIAPKVENMAPEIQKAGPTRLD